MSNEPDDRSPAIPDREDERQGLSVSQWQVWQGHLPPPEAVERYETVLPGSFDRLLTLAERQQALQFEENARVQGYVSHEARRGQWMGLLVTCAAIAGAIACALRSQPWVAGALVGVPVLSVACALVEVVNTRRKD